MDDADYGVVYDVLSKDFLANLTGSETEANGDQDKIIFGGSHKLNLSAHFGSLGEFLLSALRQVDPDRLAFVDASTGRKLRFRELIEGSLKVSAYLRETGLRPGDVVSIVSPNCVEFPMILYGSLFLGVTVNTCSSQYTLAEMQHVLQLARPRLVFCAAKKVKDVLRLANGGGKCEFIENVVTFGGRVVAKGKLERLEEIFKNKSLRLEDNFQPPAVNMTESVSVIKISSGTSGLPKAVALTQENILTTIGTKIELSSRAPAEGTPQIGTTFCLIPFCHTYGMFCILTPAAGGLTTVFMDRFAPKVFLDAIQRYRAELLFLVPSLWNFLSKSSLVRDYDLSSVKCIASGAAQLSREVEEAVKRLFPNVILAQGYGMTEGTLSLISRHNGVVYKAGCIGQVNPEVYCKVVDPDTGRVCGPNEPGELCFRGRTLMKGYLGNEKATRETIDSAGWLHTGDVGYYDEHRHFYIVDRLKELIKFKGFQVAPAELEDVLMAHPAVMDVAVGAVPDAVSGELPRAFVVKRPGSSVTEKELAAFVAARVSEQKRLRGGVQFVLTVPRNANGKILRRELRRLCTIPMAKL